MNEILIVVAQFLILSIFVMLMVFYGLVFWHWRNDGKQRDVRRKNPSSPVANARTFGS
jgi:cbb3-type cytochrome oxidase subunit 3